MVGIVCGDGDRDGGGGGGIGARVWVLLDGGDA